MTERGIADPAATAAFKALQAKARDKHSGDTHSLLILYAVESFLRPPATSTHAERMVLKGGMLMAASGIRVMTRGADLSTHAMASDEATIRRIVTEIWTVESDPPDGVTIEPATTSAETTRAEDESQGVRCKLIASLGRARIPFALDFYFGDPNRSTVIALESVIDRPAIQLRAYPTRSRSTSRRRSSPRCSAERPARGTATSPTGGAPARCHRLSAAELREHVVAVAGHRRQPVITMAQALANMYRAS